MFVKRVLGRRKAVLLAHQGRGVDHPSAAANIAALIETVAAKPGRRILNSADPDAPSGLEIARTIARHLDHEWQEILLDDSADPSLGWHPWNSMNPVVLDTSAALELGYTPGGDYAATVPEVIGWLTSTASSDPANLPPGYDSSYFADAFHYASEDAYLGR